MSGFKIVLGTTITDASAPKIINTDRIESSGSLMLVDAAHVSQSWVAGIPANGVTNVANILWAKAAAILGSGDATTLSGKLNKGTNWTGTTRLLERTTKGGLHGVVPIPLGVGSAQTFFSISPADPIKQYILDNPTHDFYFSLWGRVTRRSATGGVSVPPAAMEYSNVSGPVASLLTNARTNGSVPAGGRDITLSGTSPVLINNHAAAWTGTKPSTISAFNAFSVIVGPQGINGSSGSPATYDNLPSFIFYRAYLEDLTVSGRSHATLDAIDFAAYTGAVLTVGGRYYGDTYTDPSAVA